MSKEELDKLWEDVKHIGAVERLGDDVMTALGSVFGQMSTVIEKQRDEIERLKKGLE